MLIGPRFNLEVAAQGRLSRDIARLSSTISSEKRLATPSDDPVAAARIAEIGRAETDRAAWRANAESGAALAARVDAALQDAGQKTDRAVELAILARSPAADAAIIAEELSAIAGELRLTTAGEDARGQALFPLDAPLALPIGRGQTLVATATREAIFGAPGATLADAVAAVATAVSAGDDAAVAAALTELQVAQTRLNDQRGAQGVRAGRLDSALDRLTGQGNALREERTTLEATDLASAIPLLQSKALTLEAAQAAFTRINRRTLFDLLG